MIAPLSIAKSRGRPGVVVGVVAFPMPDIRSKLILVNSIAELIVCSGSDNISIFVVC